MDIKLWICKKNLHHQIYNLHILYIYIYISDRVINIICYVKFNTYSIISYLTYQLY